MQTGLYGNVVKAIKPFYAYNFHYKIKRDKVVKLCAKKIHFSKGGSSVAV